MSTKDWIEKDYYKVLGVPKDASQPDIKKAFRKKAGEFHPDRHPGLHGAEHKTMEDRFKEVGEAYAVLSDAQKRASYDRFGHQEGGFGGGDGGRHSTCSGCWVWGGQRCGTGGSAIRRRRWLA